MSSCDTLCKDQETFNKALDNYATEKLNEKTPQKGVMVVGLLIMFLILFWAVSLSMKVQDREHKILHIALALLASPVYILAYFLSRN